MSLSKRNQETFFFSQPQLCCFSWQPSGSQSPDTTLSLTLSSCQCKHSTSITIWAAFITIWSPFTIHDSHASCHPVIHFLILLFVFVPHTWMVRETGYSQSFCIVKGWCALLQAYVCVCVHSGLCVYLWCLVYSAQSPISSIWCQPKRRVAITNEDRWQGMKPLPVSNAYACMFVCCV